MTKFFIVSGQAVSPDFATQEEARAWLVDQPWDGLWALMGYEPGAGVRDDAVRAGLAAVQTATLARLLAPAPASAPARDASEPAWDGGWAWPADARPVWN